MEKQFFGDWMAAVWHCLPALVFAEHLVYEFGLFASVVIAGVHMVGTCGPGCRGTEIFFDGARPNIYK